MLDMSARHLRMRRRIMMALSTHDAEYRETRWAEFYTAIPPRVIIKLLTRLGDAGMGSMALMVFKIICRFKKYDPSRTLNIPKSAQ